MLKIVSKCAQLPSVGAGIRAIGTSSVQRAIKNVQCDTKGDTTVVYGNVVESPRTPHLVDTHSAGDHSDACPLCRLNLPSLTYKDVLILSQFMEPNGRLLPFEETKLCGRRYYQVSILVKMAQKCGLLPKHDKWVQYGPWDTLNTYVENPKRYRDQPMKLIKPDYWK